MWKRGEEWRNVRGKKGKRKNTETVRVEENCNGVGG
jgi:hypothetical protein